MSAHQGGDSTPAQHDEALINHLALPPQLPQREDGEISGLESRIISRLIRASKSMRDLRDNSRTETWDAVRRSLEASKRITVIERLERASLVSEFQNLSPDTFLPVYIRAQNAALLIYQSSDSDEVIFEAFEASPSNRDVLAAEGAMDWDFPGSVAAIPLSVFRDPSFAENLASFLEQAGIESSSEFAVQTFKAGSLVAETRDTNDPALISSMLIALLDGNGRRISLPALRKRIRDDVLWDNAKRPWRRLPFWLVMRVCLQRYLSARLGGERGRAEYKFFIVVVLVQLLEDVHRKYLKSTSTERLAHLRAKICRRLAKLETDRFNASKPLKLHYSYLFSSLSSFFNNKIAAAGNTIKKSWEAFKNESRRLIHPIPRRASSPNELNLSLKISGDYLRSALAQWKQDKTSHGGAKAPRPIKDLDVSLSEFTETYLRIAALETQFRDICANSCQQASVNIREYLSAVGDHYSGSVEQKSIMILTVMELWVRLDKIACHLYPLLAEYHPLLRPDILEVLHLPHYRDMVRLKDIEDYLRRRITGATTHLTIFCDPCQGCFADRYYCESPHSGQFEELRARIQSIAREKEAEKRKDWMKMTQEYEMLTKAIDETTCIYLEDEINPLGCGIHDPGCRRCRMKARVGRIRVHAFENPLPSDELMIRVVLFELSGLQEFQAYRDVTWLIISQLASPKVEHGVPPKCNVRDYSELSAFAEGSCPSVVLGSTTKSFLVTHYKIVEFPAQWDQVCLPNGLRYAYFDRESSMWPGRCRIRPTFSHQCALSVPPSSPFHGLVRSLGGREPSSYEVIASQTACPAGVNVHEYQAFQTLLGGTSRRLMTLATELGSSNINFSTDTTSCLVSHVALRCGPRGEPGNVLRAVHSIYLDDAFCHKLFVQLLKRLATIENNWREVYLMDIIVTLAYRVYSLTAYSPGLKAAPRALAVLDRARKTTSRWMKILQQELKKANESEVTKRCQMYALWTALLCKQTFAIYQDKDVDLTGGELRLFIQCCVATQHSLMDKETALPLTLRNAVIRDFKLMYEMRHLIVRSLVPQSDALVWALEDVWSNTIEGRYEVTVTRINEATHWIQMTVNERESRSESQSVQYNYLHGAVLIDGSPFGKLPPEHPDTYILTELFGQQSFLTCRSSVPGMQYTLMIVENHHQIHVGFRDESMVIRARYEGRILELVRPNTFGNRTAFDLPGPILENHHHWLDLKTGKLEIRPSGRRWVSSKSNWSLDVWTGRCSRFRGGHEEVLVDPHQPIFHRITRTFEGFEHRSQMTLYQQMRRGPNGQDRGTLSIHLVRLQLAFTVNRERRLYCHQLHAVVDDDQDAGTWYGLRSMLVMRSQYGPQRTVLVPMGLPTVVLSGPHVRIDIQLSGIFGKFQINQLLGRLDCAAEPALIYMRALLHAYTSFVVPDPLTGRNGTEEALHWLSSGVCQPWEPISSPHLTTLAAIADLTPKRAFYPEDSRCMKNETWNPNLTPTVQHEAFCSAVTKIIVKSNALRQFNPTTQEPGLIPSAGDSHLNKRAWVRRVLLDRTSSCGPQAPTAVEFAYQSRDRSLATKDKRYANVLETVSLIRAWPANIRTEEDLEQSLSQSLAIGGYHKDFDRVMLSDRLNIDLRAEWGGLVRLMRKLSNDPASLMYTIVPISFTRDSDMPLVRTLVAFAVFQDLRQLKLPEYPEYVRFQPNELPTQASLTTMMAPFRAPPPWDARESIGEFASAKERRKMLERQRKHQEQADEDCRFLADHLLFQWPCLEPNVQYLPRPVLIDVESALFTIRPEWTRLFCNLEFANHLKAVMKILRQRQCETLYKPPTFVPSSELVSQRRRESEIPSLTGDLLLSPGPEVSPSRGIIRDLTPREAAMDVHVGDMPPFVPLAYIGGYPIYKLEQKMTEFGTEICFLGSSKPYAPTTVVPIAAPSTLWKVTTNDGSLEGTIDELESIVSKMAGSTSTVSQRYGQELELSLQSFRNSDRSELEYFKRLVPTQLDHSKLEEEVWRQFGEIKTALGRSTSTRSCQTIWWLQAGLLFPAVTPVTVLEQLRSTATQSFGPRMKEAIVEYGRAITCLQREIRLNFYQAKGDTGRYKEEEKNCGPLRWNPMEYPDWLLLEIESNILIRADQVDVAMATISPESQANSVLQMNMGQGKTSCIIPMAALVLANRKSLVRVSVPKALIQQTGQLLHSRLGGLLNRELYHAPFSRKTPTTENTIRAFHNLHKQVLNGSGVMLCLPEHNLSFMLSGLQRILDNRVPEAGPMVKMQRWLSRVCRDILDESDYTLATRTQLIYPSGSQMAVDGHPHRWLVVEQLLRLVDAELTSLAGAFSLSVEIVRRPGGGYPLIYFLRPDIEEELMRRLTAAICGGLSGLLPVELDNADRVAIKDFISSGKPRAATIERIKTLYPDKPHVRKKVYLLRGLLVNRILMMCLKKRWNVQYGLNPDRDPIAVPFHAKGVPSEQSEWGHPDVAIIFTCLAFYYDGVSPKQLQQAVEHLLKADDPSCEYDRWAQHAQHLPGSLRDWNSINIDDEVQFLELWSNLRYNMVVVDYFLNNFVFPLHAKQFKTKLQSNGWDIPLFSSSLAAKSKEAEKQTRALTTGFSGTNDNRSMLPLTIKQEDLPSLSHTNAEVLTYLLHKRNRRYVLMADKMGRRISEEGFLQLLHNHGIRVLIDSGASILEMENMTLARKWLEIDNRAPAALYFDSSNKPWIMGRQGTRTPLVASTFADDLYECLVYIDEAHTRGTDLKLPATARGALTLGLGQTKDHTVQAAMRLRQLGTTQSVVFFAPPEVHQSITDHKGKQDAGRIDSSDVISWLLANTCAGIEQLQPLYHSQGMDFCKRMNAAASFPDFLQDHHQRESYVAEIKQEEQQSLKHLYEPKAKGQVSSLQDVKDPQIAAFVKELKTQKRAFRDTGAAVHGSALQEVEQEREVAFEVESVRQMKKPFHYDTYQYPGLHKDLDMFARTGRLPAGSYVQTHFLQAMARTGLGRKFGVAASDSTSKLFVSGEFCRTVKFAASDNFLRPVNWILWSEITQTAIIIIPEEADALIPILREPREANNTYLLTYAAPITRKMMHFNQLDYYTVPTLPKGWKAPDWLIADLGLFSGRLYFNWSEYKSVFEALGIQGEAEEEETQEKLYGLQLDGRGSEARTETSMSDSGSISSKPRAANISKPLLFLQEWLTLRRRGQDVGPTPMGYISQGKPLTKEHPFFVQNQKIGVPDSEVKPEGPKLAPKAQEEVMEGGEDDLLRPKVPADISEDESDDSIHYASDEMMYSSAEEEEAQAGVAEKKREQGSKVAQGGLRRRRGGSK
ncbi:hypothetical protein GQ53DRAFT_854400 [Thozetella sp. PMI_491]|nr:hypothetical protein GQ53DRAFT_854400 [Thozetella sp. PMI_491]